ncbi:MAG: signal peptidase I [Saccharofermentanales bacterium]|jgi:signal peptidase I
MDESPRNGPDGARRNVVRVPRFADASEPSPPMRGAPWATSEDERRDGTDRRPPEMPPCSRPPLGASKRRSTREMRARRVGNVVFTLVICLLIAILITQFIIQRNTVIGTSMLPTLESHDEVFVEKVSLVFKLPLNRGDIVTASTNLEDPRHDLIIKRIIGMPGEHVEIRHGQVYVDGQPLDEPYLAEGTLTAIHQLQYASVRLNDNEYFLMGDNRMNSRDSRDFGPIPREHLSGRLVFRFYPFDRFGKP